MHFLMMTLYATITAIVSAGIAPNLHSNRDRLVYGLKVFGMYLGIGLVLSWVLFAIPRW
ncbi:MAG: hypothetical protein HY231_05650 [Acidobacteria bacterium]|nr:hypothetical protein [Acidobacteriota bacterium]